MSALRPELVQRAKEGAYRTCVRTFSTEASDVVAVFLFYNKEKLLKRVLAFGGTISASPRISKTLVDCA